MNLELKSILLKYYDFKPDELIYINSHIFYKMYPKGSFLLKEGEMSDKVFFILNGLIREFYYTDTGGIIM